ncbi:MAG: LysM domain-containing protein [Chloroflexota bacterium]
MSKRHEQLLFRYSSALEHGDFEAVAEVLHDAEHDPALEQMILDMNAAYSAEASVNHKNPKEVPMIAALYQKRPPAYVRWQSLPLVAALAVIGLLVALLAVQTRGANFSNIGDNGHNGTPLAIAQNNTLCQTTTLAAVKVVTFPAANNVVVLGTLPAGTSVQVLDAQSVNNEQGIAIHWYFISAQAIQGWVSMDALDVRGCPQVGIAQAQAATSEAALSTTATAMSSDLASFTSTPALLLDNALTPLPQNDTAGIAQHPFYINPTFDPLELTAIVATLNATYQPMATMIPVQNSSQDAIACSTAVPGDQPHMMLYAQPDSNSPIVDFYTADEAQSPISVLQATYIARQTWYYIEIDSHPNQPRGWVSKERFDVVMGSCNTTYVQPVELATPAPLPANQQADVPAVKCPTPSSVSRIMMYARPSLDSFKFSQAYDAASYAFFLLDSTEVEGQTWYFVRIGATVDDKQGWITWDDYNILKDCAPFNAVTQANAVPVPSDGTLPLVPTIIPADASPMPADSGFLLDTCLIDLTNRVTLYAEPSNDARVTEILHIGTSLEVSAPTPDWYWVTVRFPDGVGSNGFVRAYTLKLPDDCHLTPVMTTGALVPTAVPPDVQALPTFTPVPANAQVDATDCAFDSSDPGRIKLYTYPALDSRYAYDAWSSLYIPQSDFSLLDAKDIDDQAWYFVRIHRVSMDNIPDMQGWMTREEFDRNVRCAPLMNSDTLTQVAAQVMLSAMPTAIAPTLIAPAAQALPTFTLTPANVQAVSTSAPNVSASATDKFPIYTVQAGDTVLYILGQFGLDAQAFPQLRALNFLNKDGDLTPGMVLVIPVSLPDEVTTCTILSGQSIDLRAQPLKADPVVYFLPQPTTLIIEGEFKNGDGMWAAVRAQAGSITMAGVWIQVDQMNAAATCSQGVAVRAISIPTSPLATTIATATLVR